MSIREEIELMVQDANPDAMLMDGLDDAIIGIGCQWGAKPLVIYSATRIIESLMRGDDGMDYETAQEWFGHNIECAYVGEGTPIIVAQHHSSPAPKVEATTVLTIEHALDLYARYGQERGLDSIQVDESFVPVNRFEHRGPPACIGELDGVVAVADGDNGMNMYAKEDFIAWMSEAVLFASEHDVGIREAVNETSPGPKSSDGH